MKCKKCDADLEVYDANDRAKPLRCSDSCEDNRKSLMQRGVSPHVATHRAKSKDDDDA